MLLKIIIKNTLLILIILGLYTSCKAQTIIVPIGSGEHIENDPSYYKKDINNEFNKFQGTWKYQNGNTEITLKLKKEEHYQLSNEYNFEDLLVGEYQYIESGVEKANTFLDFNNPNISGYSHKISGGVYKHVLPNYCIDNSNIAEIKVWLIINHPTDEFAEGRVILRYINENGVEKLEACIYDLTTLGDNDVKLDIPDGYYVFIKQ